MKRIALRLRGFVEGGIRANIKIEIVVIYVFLPLLLLSFALPAFGCSIGTNNSSSQENIFTLGNVGLLSPDSSADIYYANQAAKLAFDNYNYYYGDYSGPGNQPIGVYQYVNSQATASELKYTLEYENRVQLTSHGYIGLKGSVIDLYGSTDLAPDNSQYWAYKGVCQLIVLCACDSMGSGGGNTDTRLARAIKDTTSAKMVVGFSGTADVWAAAYLCINFWWSHIAGLRNSYGGYGGYDGVTSFARAKEFLQAYINDATASTDLLISFLLGGFFGVALGPLEGAAASLFEGILHFEFQSGISNALLHNWLNNMYTTMNNFTYMNDGQYIPSMTPISGDGGGGGIIITPY
jgi:hypothetical protein